MMWFENTETGQQWHVSDPHMIERLSGDSLFKEIPDPTAKPKAKPVEKKSKKAEEPSGK